VQILKPYRNVYSSVVGVNAGKSVVGDAEVYPEDSLPSGQFVGPLDTHGVTKFLWRNGKVPEWINISINAVEGDTTIVKLWCCGHFTAMPANRFNAMVDPDFAEHTPFSIRSPAPPKSWKRGDPKFELKNAQRFY